MSKKQEREAAIDRHLERMRRLVKQQRKIMATVRLTPEEYQALVDYVCEKRKRSRWGVGITPDSPVMHLALEFDLSCELENLICRLIGHEGRPTYAHKAAESNKLLQAELAKLGGDVVDSA